MPQSKAPLQGVNESLHLSAQMAVQPGGVSRFTIALDPVPFWNLHLVAENQAAKDHSAVLRADFQAAAYPPGVSPILGTPRASQQCYGIFFAQTQHRKQTAIRFFYVAKHDIIET